jgi:OOP family OmpA-OmpF porin
MRCWPGVLVATLLAGCATSTTQVTLLPDENGVTTGALAVIDPKSGAEVGQLDRPNVKANTGSHLGRQTVTSQAFDQLFRQMPAPGVHFILYFQAGTTDVSPDSAPALAQLLDLWARARDVSHIQIIAHTDTSGPAEDNDVLSLRRAEAVRDMLVRQGLTLSETNSEVIGRGERDPLVPTGDNVPEPRNRRVEVVIY